MSTKPTRPSASRICPPGWWLPARMKVADKNKAGAACCAPGSMTSCGGHGRRVRRVRRNQVGSGDRSDASAHTISAGAGHRPPDRRRCTSWMNSCRATWTRSSSRCCSPSGPSVLSGKDERRAGILPVLQRRPSMVRARSTPNRGLVSTGFCMRESSDRSATILPCASTTTSLPGAPASIASSTRRLCFSLFFSRVSASKAPPTRHGAISTDLPFARRLDKAAAGASVVTRSPRPVCAGPYRRLFPPSPDRFSAWVVTSRAATSNASLTEEH